MDQEQQRDHAEEAANRALLREEEEYVPSSVAEAATMCGVEGTQGEAEAEDDYSNYTADLVQLDHETEGIRVADGEAEVEFYVDPAAWPTLRAKIDEAHQRWLETSPKSPRNECFECHQKGGKHSDWCKARPAPKAEAPSWGPWGSQGRQGC